MNKMLSVLVVLLLMSAFVTGVLYQQYRHARQTAPVFEVSPASTGAGDLLDIRGVVPDTLTFTAGSAVGVQPASVMLHSDGRLTWEGPSMDAAAQAFWEVIQQYKPVMNATAITCP